MAEGRMIKKEIANSKKLSMCTDKAKVIYFMMLPHTDIEGRVKACPAIVKGQYLTMLNYTEKAIQKSLQELHEVGLIVLYKIDGDQYAEFTRFSDFQNLNPSREAKTKIPASTQENSGVAKSPQENSLLSKDKLSKDKLKEYCPNSNEIRLSSLLFDLMVKRKPDFKRPNLQSWAKNIDLMIRMDNRKPETIESVIRWCQQDDFWQSNILSTSKLRKQFDKLELQMQKGNKYGRRSNTNSRPDFNQQKSSVGETIEA